MQNRNRANAPKGSIRLAADEETKDNSSSLNFLCEEEQERTPAHNESRILPSACRTFSSNPTISQVRLQGAWGVLLAWKYTFNQDIGRNRSLTQAYLSIHLFHISPKQYSGDLSRHTASREGHHVFTIWANWVCICRISMHELAQEIWLECRERMSVA